MVDLGTKSFPIRTRPLRSTSGQLLQFPENKNIYDIEWIGAVDRQKDMILASLDVDTTSKLLVPRPQPIGRMEGRNGLSASSVVILDSSTIMIRDFNFKALAPGN